MIRPGPNRLGPGALRIRCDSRGDPGEARVRSLLHQAHVARSRSADHVRNHQDDTATSGCPVVVLCSARACKADRPLADRPLDQQTGSFLTVVSVPPMKQNQAEASISWCFSLSCRYQATVFSRPCSEIGLWACSPSSRLRASMLASECWTSPARVGHSSASR